MTKHLPIIALLWALLLASLPLALAGSYQFSLSSPQNVYLPGESITITAKLLSTSGPVPNATVGIQVVNQTSGATFFIDQLTTNASGEGSVSFLTPQDSTNTTFIVYGAAQGYGVTATLILKIVTNTSTSTTPTTSTVTQTGVSTTGETYTNVTSTTPLVGSTGIPTSGSHATHGASGVITIGTAEPASNGLNKETDIVLATLIGLSFAVSGALLFKIVKLRRG